MILDDWLLVANTIIIPLILFYLNKKIPKRYGGHIIPKDNENVEDHSPGWTKDGSPLPSKRQRRQDRIESMINIFLLAIPVFGLVGIVLRILRRHCLL